MLFSLDLFHCATISNCAKKSEPQKKIMKLKLLRLVGKKIVFQYLDFFYGRRLGANIAIRFEIKSEFHIKRES